MENYLINLNNREQALTDLESQAKLDLVSKPISHATYGQGVITSVVSLTIKSDIFSKSTSSIVCELTFPNKVMTSYINIGLESGTLSVDDDVKAIIDYYIDKLNEISPIREEVLHQKAETEKELAKVALEKQKEEERTKKQAIKLQLKKDKLMKELQSIKASPLSTQDYYYVALGWLAKHAGTVSATIPDFAEQWFEGRFGVEAPKYVVDSNKRTSGGYKFQRAPGFAISIKKPYDNMPLLIEKKTNGKTKIYDTKFVFDLVENYGFKFGPTQDIDQILDTIPSDKLDSFKKGYES